MHRRSPLRRDVQWILEPRSPRATVNVVEDVKQYPSFGYDVIINNFEPMLWEFMRFEIFYKKFPAEWRTHVPKRVVNYFENLRKISMDDFEDLDEFFEKSRSPT